MRTSWMMMLLLLLLISPQAEAVRRSPDHQGEVLIVPYYSVRAGRNTLLEIANLRAQAKAVKVRVRESHFGKLLHQFNLYLAPNDRWTATLFEHEGRMVIGTSDRSCTVPDLIGNASAPRLGQLAYWPASDQSFTGANTDVAGTDLSRTFEGLIEVFEMGEVLPGSSGSAEALAFAGNDQQPAWPRNCQQLNQALAQPGASPGYWLVDPTRDLGPARGGLSAEASVVHVRLGYSLEIPIVALTEFRIPNAPLLHTPPDSTRPDLDDALSQLTPAEAHAFVYDEQGQEVQLRYPEGQVIDAVSAVLAVPGVQAAYSKSRDIDILTDWVLAQPTRRFYGGQAPYEPQYGSGQFATMLWLGAQGGSGFDQGVVDCELIRDCPYGGANWWNSVIPVLTIRSQGYESVVGAVELGSPTAFRASEGRVPAPLEGSILLAFGGISVQQGTVQYVSLRPDLGGRRLAGLPVIAFAAMFYRTATATPGLFGGFADTRPLQVSGPVFVNASGTP